MVAQYMCGRFDDEANRLDVSPVAPWHVFQYAFWLGCRRRIALQERIGANDPGDTKAAEDKR